MARSESQYFNKLSFLIETERVFDPEPYDKPFDDWTREEKAHLTRLYNKARLATSTHELARKPRPGDYAEMARLIRPFTKGFTAKQGYNLNRPDKWSPAKKAKLTRYYKEAVMLASRPFQIYHPPSKKHAKVAREASGQSKGFPQFKGIFVPVQTLSGDAKISVNVKRGTLEVQARTHKVIAFDWSEYGVTFADLEENPASMVRQVVEQLGFNLYSITAGQHEVGKGVPRLYSERQLPKAVQRLVEKYNADTYDPDDPNSHYFGNWMWGIKGYDFVTREDRDRWVSRSREEANARKHYKNLVRRRMRYARGQTGRKKKRGKKTARQRVKR